MRSFLIVFASLILVTSKSYGRVFDFDSQTFSTYLRATGGFCNLQREAYAQGFPGSINFSDSNSISSAYSAELGVALTKPGFTTRLGVELLYPYSSAGSNGNNSGGAPYLNVVSQTYSIIPQVDLEIYLKKKPTYRIYFGLGAGYAITTFKNTVTMTALGTTTFGIQNYIEEATGWGIMGQGYLGLEIPAFDNVSVSFDVGYRYLMASNYTSNRSFTSPLGGPYQTGSPIADADGSSRTTDLGGTFAALNFRFYFNQ